MKDVNDNAEPEIVETELTVENDDSPIEIEAVEETPSEPRIPSVKDGIEELRAQLEAEREARRKAEEKATLAAKEAEKVERLAEMKVSQAKNEVQDTNLQLINGAITDIKREQAMYKAAIRDAMANGEYDKAADLQEHMAVNVAKMMRLEEGKAAYEAQIQSTPRISSADPVEEFAQRLSPRSADWIRKNPDFVTDPRLNRKMIAAHEMAIADGNVADTDEYFDYVERMLNVNRREAPAQVEVEAESVAAKPVQRRQSPPAAPVSRQAPVGSPRPNVVRLTSAEREMAQMMGMTNEEYAKNKLLLVKEGKLSH